MNIWFILIVLVLAVGLLWLMQRFSGKRARFNTQARAMFNDRWQHIEGLMVKDRAKEAIMEADKLVDFAFREMNLRGETFADRLRAAQKMLPNYKDIWSAHKLRNQLAHELGAEVNQQTAAAALRTFQQTLKYLKAL